MRSRSVKGPLVDLIERTSPWLAVRLRAWVLWVIGEPEMRLSRLLADRSMLAVDVGAHAGAYSYHLMRHFLGCRSFEPHPRLARLLRSGLPDRVIVEQVALSDSTGPTVLRVPRVGGRERSTRATIEPDLRLDGDDIVEIETTTRRLDDYELDPVGFVKIDAEGHELRVLGGGRRLLQRDHPAVLVEAEERHHRAAVDDVTRFLTELGYQGLFLWEGRLLPIERFEQHHHQAAQTAGSRRRYVNNFLYVARPEHTASLRRLMK